MTGGVSIAEDFQSLVVDAAAIGEHKTISLEITDQKYVNYKDSGGSVTTHRIETQKDRQNLIIELGGGNDPVNITIPFSFEGHVWVKGCSKLRVKIGSIERRPAEESFPKDFKASPDVCFKACAKYHFVNNCRVEIERLNDHVHIGKGCTVEVTNPGKGKVIFLDKAKEIACESTNLFAIGNVASFKDTLVHDLSKPTHKALNFIHLITNNGAVLNANGSMSDIPTYDSFQARLQKNIPPKYFKGNKFVFYNVWLWVVVNLSYRIALQTKSYLNAEKDSPRAPLSETDKEELKVLLGEEGLAAYDEILKYF